jgi:hypothetical protein
MVEKHETTPEEMLLRVLRVAEILATHSASAGNESNDDASNGLLLQKHEPADSM